ncbi:glycosyltransferase N-terminal domain-containing protein [Thioclava sp. A2]|uniref:3-deoxy-D-manno-octulosonic acid transferase n=1 Tax=Thioclava sp. FCG-A2 TaxID=3080562 RepID=UPI0029537742|nr:glycosyltransferase N-terminal domain-containing protein [Thioclava sp. A2]MDV7270451.1 glycosyltransferase N-terminal domain-containing protein [Thioclava sp. A2]
MALYRLLIALLAPFMLARLLWRVLRGHEDLADLAERLGGGAAGDEGPIWLHAASNGELASARPLIDALLQAAPEVHLLITVNTVTAKDLAQSWREPRIEARLAPLDLNFCLKRFVTRHSPRALIVIENELWPNRLTMAAQAGLPVFIFGARMSAQSAERWRQFGTGGLMSNITALSAQDETSEAGFAALGVARDRILPRINLKRSVSLAQPETTLDWPRAETVLAASTHEGEEALILDAYCEALAERPTLRLILAPRHPRRAAEIADLILQRDLDFTSRSLEQPAIGQVFLADTMGEMANWYASAGICIIGGTFAPKGGHTPFEPARFGCALLHGPDIGNFREVFNALDAASAARTVADSSDLAAALVTLDKDAQSRFAVAAATTIEQLSGETGPEFLAAQVLDALH